MAKVRTTLTVEEEILRAVKIKAARTGRGDSEVIEEALRKELGLGLLELAEHLPIHTPRSFLGSLRT